MTRVGEKYIIEVGSEYGNSGPGGPNKLYRIKGFNSLIFDDEGLRRLTKYEPPEEKDDTVTIEEIQDAMTDVSEMSTYERGAALRITDFEGCMKYAMRNMKSFLRDIRDYRKPVEIGDEVKRPGDVPFVVASIENGLAQGYSANNLKRSYSVEEKDVVKTGRKFTAEEVETIKKMRQIAIAKGV